MESTGGRAAGPEAVVEQLFELAWDGMAVVSLVDEHTRREASDRRRDERDQLGEDVPATIPTRATTVCGK